MRMIAGAIIVLAGAVEFGLVFPRIQAAVGIVLMVVGLGICAYDWKHPQR
jgi:hypothetical protein